jgi:hypothetical protein
MGAVAKSYLWKGFLIFEKMRNGLVIYEDAVSYMRKILFSFFISVHYSLIIFTLDAEPIVDR